MADGFDEGDWPATFAKYERPKGRMTLPVCPACGRARLHVDVRTSDTLHLRCQQCGHQTSVVMPSVAVML